MHLLKLGLLAMSIITLTSFSAQAVRGDHLHCRNVATGSVFNMWLETDRMRAYFLLDSRNLRKNLTAQGTKVIAVEGTGTYRWESGKFRFAAELAYQSSLTIVQEENGVLLTYLSTNAGFGDGTPSTFLFNPGECYLKDNPL